MKNKQYVNNDLVEGESAFCQPGETLLTEALAEVNSVFRGLTKMQSSSSRSFFYTEQTIKKTTV